VEKNEIAFTTDVSPSTAEGIFSGDGGCRCMIPGLSQDNKETTISQSARATPTHPAPTTNTTSTTSAALTLSRSSDQETRLEALATEDALRKVKDRYQEKRRRLCRRTSIPV
ncbi:hypothetical protein L9F63_008454, partial [Diploptera punctata]